MTWEDFYLVCFFVGLLLSVISFLLGGAHIHVGHFHLGHVQVKGGGHGGGASVFNFATLTAFLAWFGGAGYLLSRYSVIWAGLTLAAATVAGLAGGGLIFWFLVRLAAESQPLDPADFELVGALGRLSPNIREGGVGEMIFSRNGARKSVGARSEDGKPIPKGTEVVITRYEKGIAYVRRWDELAEQSE